MKSGGGLVIGLSLVFGCLFLAVAAELYYLLWWKKRISSRESEEEDAAVEDYKSGSYVNLVCWKKPSSTSAAVSKPDPESEPDLEQGTGEGLLKGGGEGEEEESVELELMRLHNLAGPPRFLFTIKEESKEDLESEDGKSRASRTKSLSEILLAVENNTTPLFTPLQSPRYSNPLEPSSPSYHRQGFNFNPLFESSAEAELNRLRSSPPPKFKFLRDAEEKLLKRLLEESQSDEGKPLYPAEVIGGGSFLGFLHTKNREILVHHHHLPPLTSSQVTPLASSPAATISDR